jgi:hypothetical protein
MRAIRQVGLAESTSRQIEDGVKLTTFIPVRFVRHQAKKMILRPTADGRMAVQSAGAADATLMRALARGLYWQQLLDEGRVASIRELAEAEGMDKVRVQKTLKLARLAPDLVENIAKGEQPVGLTQEFFMRHPLPDDWEAQRQVIGEITAG